MSENKRVVRIEAEVYKDGRIITDIVFPDDMLNSRMKQIIDTRDEQVKEALIKLGWTPPPDDFIATS